MINLFSNKSQRVTIVQGPFRGAKLMLVPNQSRRKIFGIYENVLNSCLETVLPHVDVVWDVGANDGYFCYGCAHRILSHQGRAVVIAFEPGLARDECFLREASSFAEYRSADFHFVPKLVANRCADDTITLEQLYREWPELDACRLLVKVDVEGGELDVLSGAGELLRCPHHRVVEVHGDSLVQPVLQQFDRAGRQTELIRQQPHWLVGSEQRTIRTCWVVTV